MGEVWCGTHWQRTSATFAADVLVALSCHRLKDARYIKQGQNTVGNQRPNTETY